MKIGLAIGDRWKARKQRAAAHAEQEREFLRLASAADRVIVECSQRSQAPEGPRLRDTEAEVEDPAFWVAAAAQWEERAADLRRWAAYRAFLSRRYERAASRPWAMVSPDPSPESTPNEPRFPG
jgi:hypothetical protein